MGIRYRFLFVVADPYQSGRVSGGSLAGLFDRRSAGEKSVDSSFRIRIERVCKQSGLKHANNERSAYYFTSTFAYFHSLNNIFMMLFVQVN